MVEGPVESETYVAEHGHVLSSTILIGVYC